MNNKEDLQRKTAYLESRVDQLESELAYLNRLLVHCGFPSGIRSLKATIQDLLSEADDTQLPDDFAI